MSVSWSYTIKERECDTYTIVNPTQTINAIYTHRQFLYPHSAQNLRRSKHSRKKSATIICSFNGSSAPTATNGFLAINASNPSGLPFSFRHALSFSM